MGLPPWLCADAFASQVNRETLCFSPGRKSLGWYMGRNAAWLNEKQVDVLEWIKAGCPSTCVEDDYRRRITARALERRGLVKIRGHGGSWAATVTKAGLAWQQSHPAATLGDAQVAELIQRVQAAGGRLELSQGEEVKAAHEELVRRSDHSPHRPRGWRLSLHSTGPWEDRRHEVILVRHFEDLVDAIPVPVPGSVARYHPTVKAFLADRNRHRVGKENLDRAARVLQAIADEAPRRRLEVLSADQAAMNVDAYTARSIGRCHLALRSPAGVYGVRIQEISAPRDKTAGPRTWSGRRTHTASLDAHRSESPSTVALELIVEGPGTGYSGDRYRDAKTISVEDKLPRVFRAIEIHRLEAELREQERQREASERRRRWEAAMAEARRRYDDRIRWDAFVQRSRDWRDVAAHREFLAAAREALVEYSGPRREDLAAHLEFAQRRLDELDPISHLELILPAVPDPKPDDLKSFLHGWSPHGPDALGW